MSNSNVNRTPEDAARGECGCESPVCARFIMNGPLGEQFKEALARAEAAERALAVAEGDKEVAARHYQAMLDEKSDLIDDLRSEKRKAERALEEMREALRLVLDESGSQAHHKGCEGYSFAEGPQRFMRADAWVKAHPGKCGGCEAEALLARSGAGK